MSDVTRRLAEALWAELEAEWIAQRHDADDLATALTPTVEDMIERASRERAAAELEAAAEELGPLGPRVAAELRARAKALRGDR